MIRSFTSALVGTMAFFLSGGALAQDDSYFGRYDGEWQGKGMVKVEQLPSPMNVDCTANGKEAGSTSFELSGNCTAMLVMNRDIGASLKLDKDTGMFTGTYIGSSSGPAKLVGKLEGDTLELKVTWGRVIYDDNTADMQIRNNGNGEFSMKVVELIDGKSTTVSDLSFNKG